MQPELIFTEHVRKSDSAKHPRQRDADNHDTLSLPFDRRQIARQRVELLSGKSAGLKLARGTVLRGGDLLLTDDGETAQVVAAHEQVSVVHCERQQDLARAAYHLGNRHVWVQVGPGWLRYLHDHVLDRMIEGLGLSVAFAELPFEPEAGAYSAGGHGHAHHSHAGHEHAHQQHDHG